MEYAQEHLDYEWRGVLFSDEKSFWLGSGPTHAWQDPKRRKTREIQRHPKKLHVWGAMGSHVKAKLYFFQENLTAPLYTKIITSRLQEKKLIYSQNCPKKYKKKWVFLQDNDPKHKASESMEELKKLVGTRLIPHPVNSPDLNAFEDMWSYLDRKVKAARIKSISGLKRFLTKEWENIPWSEMRKSVDSMPRRLQECIERQGGRTHY